MHGQVLKDLLPSLMEEVVQKAVDPFYPPEAASELPEPLQGFELLTLSPFERPSIMLRSRTLERTLERSPSSQQAVQNRAVQRRITDDRLARSRVSRSSFASPSPCSSEVFAGLPNISKTRVPLVPTGVFRC